jgi:hypothetical protein
MAQTTFSGPVESDNGFILPSYTTAGLSTIQSPAAGTIVFNTTTGVVTTYNGTAWV